MTTTNTKLNDLLKAMVSGSSPAGSVASTISTTTATSKDTSWFELPKYRSTDGALVYGIRLENTNPGHDKEYTITVTRKRAIATAADEYVVEGSWGKIGGTLSTQIKDIDGSRSTPNRARAIEAAKDLERAKRVKGYVEQFRYEQDPLDDLPDVDSIDWEVQDDLIVDAEIGEPTLPAVDRNCYCNTIVEEVAQFAYIDPEIAGIEIAPMLHGSGFSFIRFKDHRRGPRWIITVLASCSPYPEPHARAIPVGSDTAASPSNKRSVPEYVEDLIIDALKPSGRTSADFIILAEERGVDLVVIDAFRWNATSLVESNWEERRQAIEETFGSVFRSERKAGRQIELAPRVINRLRETYLTEGDKFRFELHAAAELPGNAAWQLPRL